MDQLVIGVLALQGAFAKHAEVLIALGAEVIEVRKPADLQFCDGLVIPGGESTTMMKQIKFVEFSDSLHEFSKTNPVFGTCAGLILMSRYIINDQILPLQLLDIDVQRNAFGRQADSFQANLEVHFLADCPQMAPAFFIRAPKIAHYGPEVQVLSSFEGDPVLVQQGFHLGATFHPELTSDHSIHSYFLSLVSANKKKVEY